MQQVPLLIDMTDANQLQAINDQWRQLPLVTLGEDTGVFSELGKFALDALVFPYSNASHERVFFKVNL